MASADCFTWAVTLVCLAGTVLNVRKSPWCFRLWIVGNLAWLYHDLRAGLLSRALLDLVQLALAWWGMRAWGKDGPGQSCPGPDAGA